MTLLERPEVGYLRRAVRAALRGADVILYPAAEDALVEAFVRLLLEDRDVSADIVETLLRTRLEHLCEDDAERVRQAARVVRRRVQPKRRCVVFTDDDSLNEAEEG